MTPTLAPASKRCVAQLWRSLWNENWKLSCRLYVVAIWGKKERASAFLLRPNQRPGPAAWE